MLIKIRCPNYVLVLIFFVFYSWIINEFESMGSNTEKSVSKAGLRIDFEMLLKMFVQRIEHSRMLDVTSQTNQNSLENPGNNCLNLCKCWSWCRNTRRSMFLKNYSRVREQRMQQDVYGLRSFYTHPLGSQQ